MNPALGNTSGARGTVGVVGWTAPGRALARALATRSRVLVFRPDPIGSSSHETYRDHLPAAVEVTGDSTRLGEPDSLLVCVPVPRTAAGAPDTSGLAAAATEIARRLRSGQLVALTTPVPPGTTRAVVLPVLAAAGPVPERDFFLAYSSAASEEDVPAPRAVGGFGDASLNRAAALFEAADPTPVRLQSLEAAEVYGLVRSARTAIHAGVASELKRVCERVSADVWEAIAASGVTDPAPRLGGQDASLAFLAWGARRVGIAAPFAALASEVNAGVPGRVVSKVIDALNDVGKPVRGSHILIVGTASRAADDWRGPHAVEVIDLLLGKGAVVTHNDPNAPGMTGSPLTSEFLAQQDCVLIAARRADYDYQHIVAHSRLVVDACGATRDVPAESGKVIHV